jgi:hypothetical protein
LNLKSTAGKVSAKIVAENVFVEKSNRKFTQKSYRKDAEFITVEVENGISLRRNRKWKMEIRIRKMLIEKKLKISTEVVTAVWRNSWFCLYWKILRIFQFGFSKIFFLNCR